ncbi:MAG: hypothetical protein ABIL58_23245 [Pseudomonadota bacterium]
MNPLAEGMKILIVGSDPFAAPFTHRELDDIYYGLSSDQGALLLESAAFQEVDDHFNPGSVEMVLEAIRVQRFAQAESKMKALVRVLNRHSKDNITALDPVIGPPRKSGLFATVTVQLPMSDGQVVSIVFHSPSGDDRKILPDDTIIAFRWLLNKRDITHAVSPERGQDVSLDKIGTRVMQIVAKNSEAFQRAQAGIKAQREELATVEQGIADAEGRNQAAATQLETTNYDAGLAADEIGLVSARLEKVRQENADLEAQIEALRNKKQERSERDRKPDADPNEGLNGYIAFYKGKRIEVFAKTSFEAQQKAAATFGAKKSYDVTVELAQKAEPAPEPPNKVGDSEIDSFEAIVAIGERPDLPPGNIVFNAPRPLAGHKDWQGDFRHGIYYAAVDPNGERADWMVEQNRDLDGWIVIYLSREEYLSRARSWAGRAYPDMNLTEFSEDDIIQSYGDHLEKLKTYGAIMDALAKDAGEAEPTQEPEPEKAEVGILPPAEQTDGNPAKRAAKILHGQGLATEVMQVGFQKKLDMGDGHELWIQTNKNQDDVLIRFDHYVDQTIDGDMAFVASTTTGMLTLSSVGFVAQSGQYMRRTKIGRAEKSMANTLSKSLIDRKFDSAAGPTVLEKIAPSMLPEGWTITEEQADSISYEKEYSVRNGVTRSYGITTAPTADNSKTVMTTIARNFEFGKEPDTSGATFDHISTVRIVLERMKAVDAFVAAESAPAIVRPVEIPESELPEDWIQGWTASSNPENAKTYDGPAGIKVRVSSMGDDGKLRVTQMDTDGRVTQWEDIADPAEANEKALSYMRQPVAAPGDEPDGKFSPGDTVYLYWEATGKDEPVNFRGPVGDDQAVVVKDGKQLTVKYSDLKAEPAPAPEPDESMNTFEVGGIKFTAIRKETPRKHWVLRIDETGEEFGPGTGGISNESRPKMQADLEYAFKRTGNDENEWRRQWGLEPKSEPTPEPEPVPEPTTSLAAVNTLNDILAGKYDGDSGQIDALLDQAAGEIEAAGRMEELEPLLNQVADHYTEILKKEAA